MAKLFSSLRSKNKQKPLISRTHEFYVRGKRFIVDDYYIIDELPVGSGAYGDVCSATNTKLRGARVAIKKISKCFSDIVDAKRILREVKMLAHFDHPNVVPIVDMIPPKNPDRFRDVYICLKLIDTDLQKLLRSRKRELSLSNIRSLTYQLLCALKYIHSARVMHRDLKPSNLLISLRTCSLHLCDFGLARPIDYSADITEYVVTRWYRAPEIICASQHYDEKSDLWSVGCILIEMFTRAPLFKGRNYLQQLELIFNCLGTHDDFSWVENETAVRFLKTLPSAPSVPFREKFSHLDEHAVDLASQLLQANPHKRSPVEDALRHPFFAECRKPSLEITSPTPFDYTYEDTVNTEEELKRAMFAEVVKSRRRAQRRQKSWFN